MAGKGTDADLINISGTAQGDIYYNNGSAIARLAPGTASQVLQTGGAGANPSWATISGDLSASGSTQCMFIKAFFLQHFQHLQQVILIRFRINFINIEC